MKRRTKGKLILLFSAIASLCFFAGCKERLTKEEVYNQYELTSTVTYYANGGEFEDRETTKSMGYRDGSRVLNLGVDKITSNDLVSISYSEHTIIGWYEVEMRNGKPVYLDESKGIVKLTNRAVSFDDLISANEEWHIGMKWKEYAKINFQLVCENPTEKITVETADGNMQYRHGDVIKTRSFYYGAWEEVGVEPVEAKDNSHTFLSYYKDAACTQALTDGIAVQEDNLTVYAKYLTGNWSVVKNKNDFQAAFSRMNAPMSKNTAGLYLANDIDCTGLTFAPIANFQNKFEGNGYTISNMTVQQSSILGGKNVALFGNIMATATIKDVTFENLSIRFIGMNNASFNAYFAFSALAEGATVENVELSGTMSVQTFNNGSVLNMANDNYTKCLYGGYATDEAYVTASGGTGITVVGSPEEFITIQ